MLPAQKGAEWHARRRSSIGGSDANIIMSGDREKILDLWRVKTGGEPDVIGPAATASDLHRPAPRLALSTRSTLKISGGQDASHRQGSPHPSSAS